MDEMTSNKAKGSGEFSYLVKVGHISANPVQVHVEADERERANLAELWKVETVNHLAADLQIARWKKDGVRIKGHVTGEVVQSCVVTLEPVVTSIEQDIDQIYVPEGSKLARIVLDGAGEMVLDPEGPDLPEQFTGGYDRCRCAGCRIRRARYRPLSEERGCDLQGAHRKQGRRGQEAIALCCPEGLEKGLSIAHLHFRVGCVPKEKRYFDRKFRWPAMKKGQV
jgi:hypothetical protein